MSLGQKLMAYNDLGELKMKAMYCFVIEDENIHIEGDLNTYTQSSMRPYRGQKGRAPDVEAFCIAGKDAVLNKHSA